jgi:hypothetical protein
LALYLVYLIEFEPVEFGKKLNNQANDKSPDGIKNAAISKVWIIVTISILFTICTIITDIGAVVAYSYLPKEIESYIHDNSRAFSYLRAIPILMLFFDVLSLGFIFVPFIVACCKQCKSKCKFKVSDFLYTLLSPLSCITTHSYHIIFAFINNPYHATSVLLFYIMTLFVVVVIFQKTYYFVLICFTKLKATSSNSAYPADGKIMAHVQRYVLVRSFIAVIIALAVCIGLTIAVLIALPINNAIDMASAEIYAIYQASVTVFAALVTFEVFFRHTNSIFAVFVKAADKLRSSDQNWKDKSEKEKEEDLGEAILKYIGFEGQQMRDVNNFQQTNNSISTMLLKAADNLHSADQQWNDKSLSKKEEYLGEIILKHIRFQSPGDAGQQLEPMIPHKTISTMLIKAADKLYSKTSDQKWKEKTEDEKEEDLGKAILMHIGFQPTTDTDNQQTDESLIESSDESLIELS